MVQRNRFGILLWSAVQIRLFLRKPVLVYRLGIAFRVQTIGKKDRGTKGHSEKIRGRLMKVCSGTKNWQAFVEGRLAHFD